MKSYKVYLLTLWVATKADYVSENSNPGRIVGGQPASISEAPFTFSFQVAKQHVCGGILIHPYFVLTAAHCFVDIIRRNVSIKYLAVRGGSSDSTTRGDFIKVVNYTIHEYYNPVSLEYDVALLKLTRQPRFSQFTIKVGIMNYFPPYVGDMLTVVGWGALQEGGPRSIKSLQKLNVRVYSNRFCASLFQKYYRRIYPCMLCAGDLRGGRDTCKGDSGGPLFNSKKEIIGVVSFGEGCARPGLLGVYTRITYIYVWVRTHASMHHRSPHRSGNITSVDRTSSINSTFCPR